MSSFKQLSGPVKYALVAVVIVGAVFLGQKFLGGGEEVPPPPIAAAPAPTGATGGSTSEAGATGASGPTMSVKEIRAEKRRVARAKLVESAKVAGIPLNVYEPLEDGKIVMIFFYNPKSNNDQLVNQSVKEVKDEQGSKLVVITDEIANRSKYAGIAKATEITQTPGIVILYKHRADTWQGYIDGVALNSRVERLVKTRPSS